MSMVIDGTNGLTFPSTTVQGDAGIGYGQTWSDVTASRSVNTTYTNSTGKPILVLITNSSGAMQNLQVNGVTYAIAAGSSSYNFPSSVIVPNGSTYKVSNSGGAPNQWSELR